MSTKNHSTYFIWILQTIGNVCIFKRSFMYLWVFLKQWHIVDNIEFWYIYIGEFIYNEFWYLAHVSQLWLTYFDQWFLWKKTPQQIYQKSTYFDSKWTNVYSTLNNLNHISDNKNKLIEQRKIIINTQLLDLIIIWRYKIKLYYNQNHIV